MVNGELVRNLIMELEKERGSAVQLRIEIPNPYIDVVSHEHQYLGSLGQRHTTVTPISGKGAEYIIAGKFAGEYNTLVELCERVRGIASQELPPGNQSMDAPLNIRQFLVRTDGIFAQVDGTYHPDGVLKMHPGFENARTPYELKVADISLRLM